MKWTLFLQLAELKVNQFNIVLFMIEMGEINKKTNIPPILRSSFFIREVLRECSLTRLITSLISATAHFSTFQWNFLIAAEFIDRPEFWERGLVKMQAENFRKPNSIFGVYVETGGTCSLHVLNVLKFIHHKFRLLTKGFGCCWVAADVSDRLAMFQIKWRNFFQWRLHKMKPTHAE